MHPTFCECGCGELAPIATRTHNAYGHVKGMPIRFINGHCSRVQPIRQNSHAWHGGIIRKKDRVLVYMPEHHKAHGNGYVLRYVLIAEKAMKTSLPMDAVIHHIDTQKDHDANSNLIVCENDNYHRLIHKRKRAFDACGNPKWRKCSICGQYDNPKNLYIREYKPKGGCIYHKKCKSLKQKKEYQIKEV